MTIALKQVESWLGGRCHRCAAALHDGADGGVQGGAQGGANSASVKAHRDGSHRDQHGRLLCESCAKAIESQNRVLSAELPGTELPTAAKPDQAGPDEAGPDQASAYVVTHVQPVAPIAPKLAEQAAAIARKPAGDTPFTLDDVLGAKGGGANSSANMPRLILPSAIDSSISSAIGLANGSDKAVETGAYDLIEEASKAELNQGSGPSVLPKQHGPLPVAAIGMEDVRSAAPANQGYERHLLVESLASKIRKPRTCVECGYSLEGLKTGKCPECGTVNVMYSRSAMLEEDSQRIVREEYTKPIVLLLVGCVLTASLLAISGDWFSLGAWVIGLPIRVTLGSVAFFLCCLWFFGFDSPIQLTALRLAAMYAIGDVVLAVPVVIGIHATYSLAFLIVAVIHVFMFVWLFELDVSDAYLVVAITAVVNFWSLIVIGIAVSVI